MNDKLGDKCTVGVTGSFEVGWIRMVSVKTDICAAMSMMTGGKTFKEAYRHNSRYTTRTTDYVVVGKGLKGDFGCKRGVGRGILHY